MQATSVCQPVVHYYFVHLPTTASQQHAFMIFYPRMLMLHRIENEMKFQESYIWCQFRLMMISYGSLITLVELERLLECIVNISLLFCIHIYLMFLIA